MPRPSEQECGTHSTVSVSCDLRVATTVGSNRGLLGATEESSDGSRALSSRETTSEPPTEADTDTTENPSEID